MVQASPGSLNEIISFAKDQEMMNQIVRKHDMNTGQPFFVAEKVTQNFDARSIQAGIKYDGSAVGEMNYDELEQLRKLKNEAMDRIEKKFKADNENIGHERAEERRRRQDQKLKEGVREAK